MKVFKFLLFLYANLSFCQTSNEEILASQHGNNCVRNKDVKFEKLIKKYPFNKASKIQIVSFVYENTIILDDKGEGIESIQRDSLPRKGNWLDYENLKEYKDLELPSIKLLTDVLYNYNYDRKKGLVNTMASCYMPRNAIVFLDKEDSIIEFLEICFDCSQVKVFKKDNFGEFCQGKLDLIKNFFLMHGIKYGIKERE
ncbi:hypothetical protein ACI6PS_11890 [Flavobacterium sp. PLA-1-15]|uniref:hypothetical protein n=1 Tax=Flavobacterium sp. PLA-1-15 TaxID=3380533 RepID=UPI003B80E8F0